MSQTQEERKAETRARLLSAAAELFADQGMDAVSVDAVAEAAGRTSGAVYAHFGSKQGLLLALLDSWKDSVRTVLLAEVAVSESPRGQLAAVWVQCGGHTRRRLRTLGSVGARAVAAGRPRPGGGRGDPRTRPGGPPVQRPSAGRLDGVRSAPARPPDPTSWQYWSKHC